MARAAKVISIEAIQAFSFSLDNFREEAAVALEGVTVQLRRAVDWVQHQQKDYWSAQLRRAEDQHNEARINLYRARTVRRIGDVQPSCIDEQRAVDRARRRVVLCQQKREAVRHWTRAIDRALNDYVACVSQLNGWLDADAPKALASLQQIVATLENYVAVPGSSDIQDLVAAAGATQSTTPRSEISADLDSGEDDTSSENEEEADDGKVETFNDDDLNAIEAEIADFKQQADEESRDAQENGNIEKNSNPDSALDGDSTTSPRETRP